MRIAEAETHNSKRLLTGAWVARLTLDHCSQHENFHFSHPMLGLWLLIISREVAQIYFCQSKSRPATQKACASKAAIAPVMRVQGTNRCNIYLCSCAISWLISSSSFTPVNSPDPTELELSCNKPRHLVVPISLPNLGNQLIFNINSISGLPSL